MKGVDAMYTLKVSSKGQIVLPAEVRKRLGMGLGAQLELSEDADGLRLRVLAARPSVDISHMAGMVRANSLGQLRRLEDFDPAAMLAKP
jgi:AbrB family looped-hinge helix DNA binding protein